MAAELFYTPAPVAFTSNGLPSAGAEAYFYASGTLDPQDVYTTSALTTPHANPVVANGAGRVPAIYLDSDVSYRLILKDRAGNTIDDIDPYLPPIGSGVPSIRVGTPTLFGYPDNDIARIYRDAGAPAGIQHTFRVISSGKGDNTTYRGVTNAYFEARDRDDVDATSKGVLYALHLSVVPKVGRNNVPFDDVACLAMGNTTGTVTAKGTDCMYISENPLFTAAGNSEWYSLFTADAKADVGIQIKYRPSSGKVARFPNNCHVTFRNAGDTLDTNAIGLTSGNVLEVGDAALIARIDMKAPANFVSSMIASLANYANDAAAAVGGIAVGQFYRNGSVVQIRVA